MSSPTDGDRYILYLPAAVENYRRIDGSLQQTIDDEISKFFDAWNIDNVWAKRRGPIGQIKNDRTVMRAFGSHWDGGTIHVVLIITIYKKNQEAGYWALEAQWKDLGRDWRERLDKRDADDRLLDALETFRERSDYRLVGPNSF